MGLFEFCSVPLIDMSVYTISASAMLFWLLWLCSIVWSLGKFCLLLSFVAGLLWQFWVFRGPIIDFRIICSSSVKNLTAVLFLALGSRPSGPAQSHVSTSQVGTHLPHLTDRKTQAQWGLDPDSGPGWGRTGDSGWPCTASGRALFRLRHKGLM